MAIQRDELIFGVSLNWDTLGFKSLNESINKSINAFAIATAAISTTNAIMFSLGKNFATTTDALLKTSQRINTTTQDIQKLTFAAEDNGATMNDVTSSLESLSKAKEEMLRGSGDFEAWGRLGVNPTQYQNTSDLLLDIADKVKDLDSQRAIDLMNRVGISSNMLQTLQQGREGLKALGVEAESLGLISTNKMVKSSQDFMSGWQRTQGLIKGVLNQVSSSLLDETINPAIKAFNAFVSKNMVEITAILKKIMEYLVKASQGIMAIFHTAYIQFERLSNLLGGFENTIKVLAGLFVFLQRRIIFALAPAIIAIGALYIAFDEVMSYIEGKESFLGDFIDNFPVLATGLGLATTALLGYVTAMKAYQIATKAGITITALFNKTVGKSPIMKILSTLVALGGTAFLGSEMMDKIDNPDIDIPDIENKINIPDIENVINNPDINIPSVENVINNPDINIPDIDNPSINIPKIDIPSINIPSVENVINNVPSSIESGVNENSITGSKSLTNNNQISINVNGNGNPVEIAEEVKKVLNYELSKSAERGGF